MRNYLIAVSACLLLFSTLARGSKNYQPVRFDLGFAYMYPLNEHYKWGAGITPELKYIPIDNLAVGFRYELFFSGAGDNKLNIDDPNGATEVSIGVRTVSSYSLITEYIFTKNANRPFIGVGIGRYSGTGISTGVAVSGSSAGVAQGVSSFSGWGLSPSIGADLGVIRLSVTYNWLFKDSSVDIGQNVSGSSTAVGVQQGVKIDEITNDYIAAKLVFRIGGNMK